MEDEKSTDTKNVPNRSYIKFILLLILEIPSITCALLILTYLFRHWQLMIKKAIRNHIICIHIIISLINHTVDLPFTMNSYRLGYDEPRGPSFCLWWYWIDYTIMVISILLTATASVQRHILIFNAHWLHSSRARWLIHYTPIILCILYSAIFYLAVIVFYPCDHSNDLISLFCFVPCYADKIVLFNIDWILNTAFPLSTIILANMTLVIRVVRSMRKIRRQKSLIWKRQRKLTLQLVILSSLYVFGWVPSTIMSILQSLVLPNLVNDIPQLDYLNYLTYFVCPLQPFIYLLSLPELTKSIKVNLKRILRRVTVTPVRMN